jgi:NAD(P)-dependent dehydrogenase (short-subunit alcohol dehydrogenase family)
VAIIVITGAGRGIGLGLAQAYAARGDTVIATVRNQAKAQSLFDCGARVETLDVSSGPSVAAFAARIADVAVDVLINNAGIYGPRGAGLAHLDMEEAAKVLLVNTLGPLRVTQALLPHLGRAGRAKVLSISSGMGALSGTSTGEIAYRASKAGLNKAVQASASELARQGIISVVAHPGWVRTDMGTNAADLSIGQSVDGLIALTDRLTLKDTGRFFDYSGAGIAW